MIGPGLKIEVAVLAQRSRSLWQGVEFLGVNGTLGLAPVFFVELEQYFTSLLALGCRSSVIVLFDEKVLLTVRTLACSMIQQGLRAKSSLFVCFDLPSLRLARNWSFETVFVESQRALEPFERHKMKLFVPYLCLCAGLTCYLLDSDVVLLDRLDTLWDRQFDIEMASNAPDVVRSCDFSFVRREVNSGLVKYKANFKVIQFLKTVILFSMKKPKLKDQASLNHFLKRAVRQENGFFLREFGVYLGVLEPLRAPTGSALFCVGRVRLRQLARMKNVSRPTAVHLNWHLYVQAKVRTLRLLGWLVNETCVDIGWNFWLEGDLPTVLRCSKGLVVAYDTLATGERPLSYFDMEHWQSQN